MATRPTFDLIDGRFYSGDLGNVRDAYAWMRDHEPVYRDDANGITAAASYDAVVAAERDPELFSNAGGIRPETGPLPQMIDMDDPQHLTRRRMVNAGFTRKKVEAKAVRIREICDQLIDAVCEKEKPTSSQTWRHRCLWPSSATCWVSVRKNARCFCGGRTIW
ncbi:hypothetical protein GCM10020255_050950 [Rhodococcus baikonurensis]